MAFYLPLLFIQYFKRFFNDVHVYCSELALLLNRFLELVYVIANYDFNRMYQIATFYDQHLINTFLKKFTKKTTFVNHSWQASQYYWDGHKSFKIKKNWLNSQNSLICIHLSGMDVIHKQKRYGFVLLPALQQNIHSLYGFSLVVIHKSRPFFFCLP